MNNLFSCKILSLVAHKVGFIMHHRYYLGILSHYYTYTQPDISYSWIYRMCSVAQSCLTLCNPTDCSPSGSSVHRDSPGKNTGVGCHARLQGIFPTQRSNPGLLHCGRYRYAYIIVFLAIIICIGNTGDPRWC